MNSWLVRDITPGFPIQNWMVLAFTLFVIWIVYQWGARRSVRLRREEAK
jgi:hypothetical protein